MTNLAVTSLKLRQRSTVPFRLPFTFGQQQTQTNGSYFMTTERKTNLILPIATVPSFRQRTFHAHQNYFLSCFQNSETFYTTVIHTHVCTLCISLANWPRSPLACGIVKHTLEVCRVLDQKSHHPSDFPANSDLRVKLGRAFHCVTFNTQFSAKREHKRVQLVDIGP